MIPSISPRGARRARGASAAHSGADRSPPTPPDHRPAKQILLPAFTPEAIARHEPCTREICRELLGRIGDSKRCDGAVEYSQEIPRRVVAHMLGVPEQG
jgi:cytochrome P450